MYIFFKRELQVASSVYSHEPPFAFPVGSTSVYAIFLDPSGNRAVSVSWIHTLLLSLLLLFLQVCTFTVLVVDTEPPTVSSCPADITVDTLHGYNYAGHFISPSM